MPEEDAICDICLSKGSALISIGSTDEKDVKWSCKLQNCVPEVDWHEELMMCKACTAQLEAACNFRALCIKSRTTLKEQRDGSVKSEDFNDSCIKSDDFNDTCANDDENETDCTCGECSITFGNRDDFFKHRKDAHSIEKNRLDNTNLPIETETLSGASEYICYHCDKSFTNKQTLASHIKSKHAVKSQSDKSNVEKVKDDEKFVDNRCEICGVVFSSKYLIRRHVRNVHAVEKKYKCDICGQKFASPVYLSAHKRYHSGERPHICSFCGKAYITASDLYHHEKIHANKRAYKCEKCPKAFNTSSDLHKHKICVHVDRSLWKYVCTYCDRRFPLKTNLDTHTKTHTGEKNFACHMCDRRCINQSVLKRHIESHSNVRSFKCDLCGQDYKYQKSLDIHMAKAHGVGDVKIPERVKKYFCHICPKSFFANNKLQKHIRSHTGEKPFACDMCDKRFIDKSYVKQHLKTAHNISQFEKTI